MTKHLRREHATEFDFVSLEFCSKIFLGLNRACGSQVREQGVFPKGWFSSSDEVIIGNVRVLIPLMKIENGSRSRSRKLDEIGKVGRIRTCLRRAYDPVK